MSEREIVMEEDKVQEQDDTIMSVEGRKERRNAIHGIEEEEVLARIMELSKKHVNMSSECVNNK